MKKILLLTLFSSTCFAEPFRYDKPLICDEVKAVFSMIEEFREVVTFSGDPEGEDNGGSKIILTQNKDTGTWTIIQSNNKYACVIAVGQNHNS